jgi:hypothetical protein
VRNAKLHLSSKAAESRDTLSKECQLCGGLWFGTEGDRFSSMAALDFTQHDPDSKGKAGRDSIRGESRPALLSTALLFTPDKFNVFSLPSGRRLCSITT